jgi:hypothetical protein
VFLAALVVAALASIMKAAPTLAPLAGLVMVADTPENSVKLILSIV